ncbi:hypothetical protein HZS_2847, partial [Henneguya salminicola]
TFFDQSKLLLSNLAHSMKELKDTYFPISIYTMIVENEDIIKSHIVSPLTKREGPSIGINILNEKNLTEQIPFKYSIICHNHLIFEQKDYWAEYFKFPFLKYNKLIYFSSFWSVVQDLMDYNIMKLIIGIPYMRNGNKYIKNAPLYCEEKPRIFFNISLMLINIFSLSLIPCLIYMYLRHQ